MLSISRTILGAIVLATSVAAAQAQTTPEQDHQAHHPQAPGGEVQTPPTMGRTGQGRGMPGMTQSGRGPAMMGGDMSQMMEMMGQMMAACQRPGMSNPGGTSLFSHLDGQLAYYKAELRITDAQLPQWNAFADVARTSASKLQPAYMLAMQVGVSASVPEQLDRRMALLSVLIETEKEAAAPLKALYAVLSPEQQKAADGMLAEHLQAMRAAGL